MHAEEERLSHQVHSHALLSRLEAEAHLHWKNTVVSCTHDTHSAHFVCSVDSSCTVGAWPGVGNL